MTALWVARPLFPSESAATHGDGLTVVMLWIALWVFWFLGAIGRPKLAVRFGCTDAAVALLMLCFTAAALWAVRHGSPRPAVNVLWEWLGMGLSFFLARQLIATPRECSGGGRRDGRLGGGGFGLRALPMGLRDAAHAGDI